MNKNKKISLALKKRHEFAKKQIKVFKSEFKDESYKYSDFLRNETPLTAKVRVYDVSYQMSYSGQVDEMFVNLATFRVISYAGNETDIQRRTMNMIKDSKGKITKSNFAPNTLTVIDEKLRVEVLPRGLEESTYKPTKKELEEVFFDNFSIKDLDKEFKFTNKKGREGSMSLDITHFK